MHRLWEHICRADAPEGIAVIAEIAKIACQGGAVTADVNDPFRLHFYHGGKEGFVATFPGRIHYDDICLNALVFIFFRKYFLCFSHIEFRIGKAV